MQREVYFVGLEKKRKSGVIRTLKNELNEEKRTLALKKQIEDTIKKHGLTAALDLINLQKEQQQQQQAQKQATLQVRIVKKNTDDSTMIDFGSVLSGKKRLLYCRIHTHYR